MLAECLILPRGYSIIVWQRTREGVWESGLRGISLFDLKGDYGRHFKLTGGDADLGPADATSDADGYGREWFRKTLGHTAVWASWGELVVLGNTSRYELRAFREDGSLVRIVRRNHVLRSTTPEDVEAHIDRMVAGNPDREARAEWHQGLQSVPVAQHLPAFARVLSDAAGYLWVQEYEAPSERPAPRRWTVFDPEGRVLGFVATPAELTIVEIGEDYIFGTTREESTGAELAQTWPLKRSATRLHRIRLRADEMRARIRSSLGASRVFRSDLTP